MTERIGNVTIICEEPDDKCTMCGKVEELRPYGPNFSKICWSCGMKNPDERDKNMHKMLFGDEPTADWLKEMRKKEDGPETKTN